MAKLLTLRWPSYWPWNSGFEHSRESQISQSPHHLLKSSRSSNMWFRLSQCIFPSNLRRFTPLLSSYNQGFMFWHGSRAASKFWVAQFRYVLLLSRQVCHDDATDGQSHHYQEKNTSFEFKALRRVRHQDLHQRSQTQSKIPITDILRLSHAIICRMVRKASHVSQSVFIKSSCQSFMRSQVTKKVFIEGVLAEIIEEIKNKELEKEVMVKQIQIRNKIHRWNQGTQQKGTSRGSTLMKWIDRSPLSLWGCCCWSSWWGGCECRSTLTFHWCWGEEGWLEVHEHFEVLTWSWCLVQSSLNWVQSSLNWVIRTFWLVRASGDTFEGRWLIFLDSTLWVSWFAWEKWLPEFEQIRHMWLPSATRFQVQWIHLSLSLMSSWLYEPWCWDSAKVKDSVVTSLESTTSRQVLQKNASWRSTSAAATSAIPSMTLVLHRLRNVKNLGQRSLTQEQWRQLILVHLFLTSWSRRSPRPSPMSMVGTSRS